MTVVVFSVLQVYELYNGGAVPVHYELDLTPLDIIEKVSEKSTLVTVIQISLHRPVTHLP